jgi:hypothetical protein
MNDIKGISETENKMLQLAISGAHFGRCLDANNIVSGANGGNSFFDSLTAPKVVAMTESMMKEQASGSSTMSAMILTSVVVGGAQVAAGAYMDKDHPIRAAFSPKESVESKQAKDKSNAKNNDDAYTLLSEIQQSEYSTLTSTETANLVHITDRPSTEYSDYIVNAIKSVCDENIKNRKDFEKELRNLWSILYPSKNQDKNSDLPNLLGTLIDALYRELTTKSKMSKTYQEIEDDKEIKEDELLVVTALEKCKFKCSRKSKSLNFHDKFINVKFQLAKTIHWKYSQNLEYLNKSLCKEIKNLHV